MNINYFNALYRTKKKKSICESKAAQLLTPWWLGRVSINEASHPRSLICITSKLVHNFRSSLPSGDGLMTWKR